MGDCVFCLPICRQLRTGECAAVAVYSRSRLRPIVMVTDKVNKKSFSEGVAGNEDSKDMDTSVHDVAPTWLGVFIESPQDS